MSNAFNGQPPLFTFELTPSRVQCETRSLPLDRPCATFERSMASDSAPHPRLARLALFGLLGVAVAFRVVGIDHWPGLNGDEAWFGINVQRWLAGGPVHWRTPTGNPLNPFHSLPLLLLHTVLPPAVWMLRLPALVANVLLVVLAWVLLRRSLGAVAGTVATVLLACSPPLLVYSRLGWDPSQSALAGLFVVHFVLAARPKAAVVSLAAAVLVHPTNVFLLPLLLVGFLDRLPLPAIAPGSIPRRTLAVAGGGAVALVAGLYVLARLLDLELGELTRHLWSPERWGRALLLFVELVNGITVYRYVAGEPSHAAVVAHDVATVLFLAVVGWAGVRALRRQRRGRELRFLLGLGACLLGFVIVAGPSALEPHHERYALFLVVPTCVALSSLLTAAAAERGRTSWATGLAVVVGALLLVSFDRHFFEPFRRTGGGSHRAFRTGERDPKQAAVEDIVRRSSGARVRILAEDWWALRPIEYFAAPARIETGEVTDWAQVFPAPGVRTFVVGFPEGPLDRSRRQEPAFVIPAADGTPALVVWELPPVAP